MLSIFSNRVGINFFGIYKFRLVSNHKKTFQHSVKSEIRKMMAKEVMCDSELRKEVGGANFLIKIILLQLYKLGTMY